MNFEIHAPSMLLLVVSLVLAVLALICFFVAPNPVVGFWMAIAAYCVMALGTMVKTSST